MYCLIRCLGEHREVQNYLWLEKLREASMNRWHLGFE